MYFFRLFFVVFLVLFFSTNSSGGGFNGWKEGDKRQLLGLLKASANINDFRGFKAVLERDQTRKMLQKFKLLPSKAQGQILNVMGEEVAKDWNVGFGTHKHTLTEFLREYPLRPSLDKTRENIVSDPHYIPAFVGHILIFAGSLTAAIAEQALGTSVSSKGATATVIEKDVKRVCTLVVGGDLNFRVTGELKSIDYQNKALGLGFVMTFFNAFSQEVGSYGLLPLCVGTYALGSSVYNKISNRMDVEKLDAAINREFSELGISTELVSEIESSENLRLSLKSTRSNAQVGRFAACLLDASQDDVDRCEGNINKMYSLCGRQKIMDDLWSALTTSFGVNIHEKRPTCDGSLVNYYWHLLYNRQWDYAIHAVFSTVYLGLRIGLMAYNVFDFAYLLLEGGAEATATIGLGELANATLQMACANASSLPEEIIVTGPVEVAELVGWTRFLHAFQVAFSGFVMPILYKYWMKIPDFIYDKFFNKQPSGKNKFQKRPRDRNPESDNLMRGHQAGSSIEA